MKKFRLENVRWYKDEYIGDYWVGDLFENGKKIGTTGNYYDLDESGRRPEKEEYFFNIP